jgi:putative DNA primase/helicase
LRVEYRPTRHNGPWIHKLVQVSENKETGEVKETWVPVCSPFGAVALLVLKDADEAYGLRVAVRDMRGVTRFVEFERGDQARLGGSEVRARLRAAGLRFEQDGETVSLQLLSAANPQTVTSTVHRAGWHWPGSMFTTE